MKQDVYFAFFNRGGYILAFKTKQMLEHETNRLNEMHWGLVAYEIPISEVVEKLDMQKGDFLVPAMIYRDDNYPFSVHHKELNIYSDGETNLEHYIKHYGDHVIYVHE